MDAERADWIAETWPSPVGAAPCSICSTPTDRIDRATSAPACSIDHVSKLRFQQLPDVMETPA